MEWEVGFPVVEQALIQAPLARKRWIFKTVAWAMHVGPYEKTGETIDQILTWMDANGYSQGGPVVEQYDGYRPQTVQAGEPEDRDLDPLPQERRLTRKGSA